MGEYEKCREFGGRNCRRTVVSVPGHCFESSIGRGRGITVGIIQSDRGDLKTGGLHHNHEKMSRTEST